MYNSKIPTQLIITAKNIRTIKFILKLFSKTATKTTEQNLSAARS